jgi:hypothetical protein
VFRERLGAPAALGLASLLCTSPVEAQPARNPDGAVLRLGVGGAMANTHVGGDENDGHGISLTAQAGVARRRVRFVADLAIQPFKVRNPVRAEAFRTLQTLASLELHSDWGSYVRAGVGGAFFWYAGPDIVGPTDAGFAFGAAIGHEFRRQRRPRLGVEGIVRWSSSSDGELTTRLFALQLTFLAGADPAR